MKYQKYNFENLQVYKLALELVAEIYKITRDWPKEELFALSSQIKRAVISIVLNIAEGSGKGSKKDFARFLSTSIGSVFEVRACLHIALTLSYIEGNRMRAINEKIDELFFKISTLRKSLSKNA